MQTRNFYFYWLPVYLYLGLIFYLSDQSASTLPHFRFDKLIHFSEYAFLGLLLMRALTKSYRQSNPLVLRFIALFIAVTYAGTDELHQRFILGRNSDFFDWLVDSFGAALSSFLFFRRSDKPLRRWFGFPYKPEGDGAASDSRSHSQSHRPSSEGRPEGRGLPSDSQSHNP